MLGGVQEKFMLELALETSLRESENEDTTMNDEDHAPTQPGAPTPTEELEAEATKFLTVRAKDFQQEETGNSCAKRGYMDDVTTTCVTC